MTLQVNPHKVTPLVTFALLFALFVPTKRANAGAIRCTVHAPAGIAGEAHKDERSGLCHGFTLTRGGKKIAEVQGEFLGSGSVLVSNDGERAVFIQSWFYGSLRGDGRLVASGLRYDELPLTNDGLVFFYRGKKTASYTLEELIHRPHLVRVGATHVHWLDPSSDLFRAPLGEILTLHTTSFRKLSFDTLTGRQVSAQNSSQWHQCTHIAYGEIHFDGKPAMDPLFAAKGDLPNRLIFRIPPGMRVKAGYQARCFRQGRTGWIIGQQLSQLNGLSIAPQARSETRFQCQQDADCTLHCDVGAVNRRWFEANRRGLGSCQEACDAEGYSAHCEHRSCVVRQADGKVHRACSRRR